MGIHVTIIEIIVIIILVLVGIMINMLYKFKHGPELDLLAIQHEYQNNAELSIGAHGLMHSSKASDLLQALKMSWSALRRTEVLHLLLTPVQIEEVALLYDPTRVIKAYQEQVQDIEDRLRHLFPDAYSKYHDKLH